MNTSYIHISVLKSDEIWVKDDTVKNIFKNLYLKYYDVEKDTTSRTNLGG